MTTVVQFIEYLKTLPPNMDVQVLELYDGAWCQESRTSNLDLDKYSDNVYVTKDTLYLGKS